MNKLCLQCVLLCALAATRAHADGEGESDGSPPPNEDLKTGKLITRGVTAGVGFAVMAPLAAVETPQGSSTILTAWSTAMPYVAVLPAFWFGSPESRAYCSTSWLGDAETEMKKRIELRSRRKAERLVERVDQLKQLPPGSPAPADLPAAIESRLDQSRVLDVVPEKNRTMVRNEVLAAGAEREALIDNIAGAISGPPVEGCGWHKLGLYAGLPVAFTPLTMVGPPSPVEGGEARTALRTFQPIISTGVVFTPNAYISILAGVTHGNIMRGETSEAKGTPSAAWAVTAALGGNLDVLTMLIPSVQ